MMVKNNLIKLKAFGLIAFLMFSMSFISCSDDDDPKSFLETHGGTVWNFAEEDAGISIYVQLNSTVSNPFEIWMDLLGVGCYLYQSIEDDGTPEVIEDSENKVVIRVEENDTDYILLTLRVVGNRLTVTTEEYEDGELDENQTIILDKSSDNVDDLEICPMPG